MKLQLSNTGTYIPECWDNRSTHEADQIKVSFTNLSHDQRKKYQHQEKTKVLIDMNATDDEIDEAVDREMRAEIVLSYDTAGMVRAMNPKISNLTDQDDQPLDTWDKITKATAPPETRLQEFITEIETNLGRTQDKPSQKN